MKTLMKNCHVVSPGFQEDELYDIYVVDGMIEEVGKNLENEATKIMDIGGNTVLPGLIDMHCNICDPGFEYLEDIETVSRSAARGGFTTITCEPNTDPVIDNKTVVEYIVSKSKSHALVNIYPYGSMSVGCKGKEMAEIGEMFDAGIVGVSDGDEFTDEASFLRNVMLYTKMFDMPVITHCEDRGLSGNGVMHEGFTASCLGLAGMPREAEEVIVARNIILAENTGVKLHVAHVSTKGSAQLIREAKKRGAKVTGETCPHYFLLTEEGVENYNTLAKINPPLRTNEDVEAIINGIADGSIDVIASGHSPSNEGDKNKVFTSADYGISSLETAFSLSYTGLVKTGIISLSKLVELMSTKPAEILKLENKGCIAKGKDADFIVVDLRQSYHIDPKHFASKAKFSPFADWEVQGRVIYTMVGGKLIM
ncbi:dihydroorotase [Anaerotignum neopropionicum]|uniref:Dihydroorotase n=1 Tax=Anaerotignum neopropionicum TaxID=36847 RepID=A0A136WD66_9FIRM|nr:dihydroorotase [Anaerotignum neopropionicum]KXL52455.1 dihydroorotase [Anaerotignum neopropionicum]